MAGTQKIPESDLKEIKNLEQILKEECKNFKENGEENLRFLLDLGKMAIIFTDKDVSENIKEKYNQSVEINEGILSVTPDCELINKIINGIKKLYTRPTYTRFEKARIVGARALQISFGAPVLVDYPDTMIDPVDIALLEFDAGLVQMSVVKK